MNIYSFNEMPKNNAATLLFSLYYKGANAKQLM